MWVCTTANLIHSKWCFIESATLWAIQIGLQGQAAAMDSELLVMCNAKYDGGIGSADGG